MQREANTEYILSISYGKDSLACLGAIEKLDMPLDRIVHAEEWATDSIPADLPPMVEFKKKVDKIIKDRYGIKVEHFCVMKDGQKLTYEKQFYSIRQRKAGGVAIYGFPYQRMPWCNSKLKMRAINSIKAAPGNKRRDYVGIAADETKRIERHEQKPNIIMPLVEVGWTEADCRKWCEENDLLSPIYTMSGRSGCWFCHSQGTEQLRLLRKNYPDLWQLLLKWDSDSPVPFRTRGQTVHDFDRRFELEDKGLIDKPFKWNMIIEKA